MQTTLLVLLALAALIALFLIRKAADVNRGRVMALTELENMEITKMSGIGSVNNLTVLPLVEYYADRDDLKTEPGIAYLIKADDTTILMDVGFNKKKEHPSPLLANMEKLGVSIGDIDMIYISHAHLDHLGGMKEMKDRTFSFSQGKVEVGAIPVHTPVEITPSAFNPGPVVKTATTPGVIKPGIINMGVIPRYLFLMGMTMEQSLAVNVKGKGIVLIVGCGHQTIERIVERAKTLFSEPIYAVIGGLHFPLKGGRGNIGPINLQYIVGSDSPPWKGISEKDLGSAIGALKAADPKLVRLSPHDSSDWSLEKFRQALGDRFDIIKAGKEIRV